MKNPIINRLQHKALIGGLCFMVLSGVGVTNAYAQDTTDEPNVEVKKRVKKVGKTYETREVTGLVKDAATGEPMGGVRVQALGYERYSALTEEDGTYKLQVPTFCNTLYIYAPEYNIQHAPIRDNKAEISLMSSTFSGFYGEGNEIISEKTINLSETSSISVETDMMNHLAGDVNIVRKNGLPGQGAYMTIRGINSLNANAQPLVVLDGNILDMQYDRTALHEGYYNNVLSGIDPENVESIQVLKNGTALYGAKGANGVIIITTKRGKSMATKINVRVYGGFELMPNTLSVMNGSQYTNYLSDLVGTVKSTASYKPGNELDSYVFLNQSPSNYFRNIFKNNTDWQKDIYRTAATQNYKISVEGGDDVGMYALSLGYTNSKSTGEGTDMDRLNLRFNTDIKIGNKITTGIDIAYNQTRYSLFDNGWSENYDMQNIGSTNVLGLVSAPFLSPYSYYMDETTNQLALSNDYAGKYASTATISNNDWVKNPFMFPKAVGINEALRNPYWIMENGEAKNKNHAELTQININVSPKYQITRTFAISDRFNYSLNRNNEKYFLPIAGTTPYQLENLGDITSVLKSQFTKQTTINNDLRLEWKNKYGGHDIDVYGGWRINKYSYSYTYMRGYNNENDKLPNISKNMQYLNYDGVNDKWMDMTYYLHAGYNYANRYYADFTISTEASSRFGRNTKSGLRIAGVSWGFFPSLQLGWVLTNEKWFKSRPNGVNYLKLTFGVEQNGNDNLDYYAARTYWESTQVTETTVGLYLKNIENSTIQWETVTKFNTALEGSFLNNRLQARLDLFWNRTSNLLSLRDLSDKYYYSGMKQYWTNEGELTNKGFEVHVNSALINKKDWKWELGATVGHYNNKITALPESKDNTIELYIRDANGNQAAEPYKTLHGYTRSAYGESNVLTAVGYSAGTFYGWATEKRDGSTKIFKDNAEASNAGKYGKLRYYTGVAGSYREFGAGDVAFVDQNNDGWIDESDKVAIGNANPDIYGNIFTNLTYKWLRLDMNFKYSLGNDIYNYQRSILESGITTYNQTTAMVRRWTNEGQVTDMPRACYTSNDSYVGNERMSDRWIEDGSYLKLKNIRLTYTLPYSNSWLQGLKIWGEANDVFTVTKYLGTDPETSANNGVLYQGIDCGRIPAGRSFMFGLSLNL